MRTLNDNPEYEQVDWSELTDEECQAEAELLAWFLWARAHPVRDE